MPVGDYIDLVFWIIIVLAIGLAMFFFASNLLPKMIKFSTEPEIIGHMEGSESDVLTQLANDICTFEGPETKTRVRITGGEIIRDTLYNAVNEKCGKPLDLGGFKKIEAGENYILTLKTNMIITSIIQVSSEIEKLA